MSRNPAAILAGRKARAEGEAGQRAALACLDAWGLPRATLETGWRVRRVGSRIVGAVPLRHVLADIVATLDGRMVLVEVKATREDGDRLLWSRLDAHQRDNLAHWSAHRALCFVAWHRAGHGTVFVPWGGAPGWKAGQSLPWSTAQAVAWEPRQSRSV